MEFKEAFLSLPEEESFKYFDIFKRPCPARSARMTAISPGLQAFVCFVKERNYKMIFCWKNSMIRSLNSMILANII